MPAQRTAPGAFSGTGLCCGAVAARTSASALFPAEKQLVACRCVLRASRPRRRQSQHSAPPRAPLRAVRARAPAWQAASGPGCALAKPGGGRAKHTQVGAPQHAGRARAAPNSAARRVMPFCCQNGTARTAPPPSPCPSPQVPSTRVYSYILQMSIPEGGGRTAYFAAFRVRYVCFGFSGHTAPAAAVWSGGVRGPGSGGRGWRALGWARCRRERGGGAAVPRPCIAGSVGGRRGARCCCACGVRVAEPLCVAWWGPLTIVEAARAGAGGGVEGARVCWWALLSTGGVYRRLSASCDTG
jgi:hypothetical protein